MCGADGQRSRCTGPQCGGCPSSSAHNFGSSFLHSPPPPTPRQARAHNFGTAYKDDSPNHPQSAKCLSALPPPPARVRTECQKWLLALQGRLTEPPTIGSPPPPPPRRARPHTISEVHFRALQCRMTPDASSWSWLW